MTKKQFIELADAIRYHNENARGSIEPTSQFDSIQIQTLADFCVHQNANFNRKRWLDYINGKCGKNGGAIK
jgi:hypothetical protein